MKHIKLLITRPKNTSIIKKNNKNILFFPLINIISLNISSLIIKLKKVKNKDVCIFISKNAIINTMPFIIKFWNDYKKIIYITIGKGSSLELKKFGIKKVMYSISKFPNSKKILNLNILKKIINKRIFLFKGNDGNCLLYKILTKRKAIVYNIITYKRERPELKDFISYFKVNKFNVVLLTSLESLKNYFVLLKRYYSLNNFLDKYLVVTSKKIKKTAILLGFNKIILSFSYKEDILLKEIKKLFFIK